MREIKFRGLNGETGWHYGIPLTNKLGTYIIFEKNPHICSQYHYIEIDEFEVVKKETVSQWTGFKDKNDVEIYEGDILEAFDILGEREIYPIIFIDGAFMGKRLDDEEFPYFYLFANKSLSETYKVIGNIYENPELLEQEK